MTVKSRLTGKTGVYKILNVRNGKVYIGSAAKCLQGRWWIHKTLLRKGLHHSRHLQAAWDKYGESSFKFSEVEFCNPADCVCREQYWMDRFQSYKGDYGYNVSPTAGSQLGFKHSEETKSKHFRGKHHSEETRKLLSEQRLGIQKFSKEAMERVREANRKTAAANRGVKRSESSKERMRGRKLSPELCARISERRKGTKASSETRAKMSESHKGKKLSESCKMKIAKALKLHWTIRGRNTKEE